MDIKDWQRDDEGNPIAPDSVVILEKDKYNRTVEELAEAAQAKANLTKEIIELRKKKEEPPKVEPSEIDKVIESKLHERKMQEAAKNREIATKRIVAEVEELTDAENLAKFNAELEVFNFDKAETVDDFMALFNKALKSTGITMEPKPVHNKDAYSNPSHSTPESNNSVELSPKEKAFVDKYMDGDVESFKKQMEKRPDYMRTFVEKRWDM